MRGIPELDREGGNWEGEIRAEGRFVEGIFWGPLGDGMIRLEREANFSFRVKGTPSLGNPSLWVGVI